MRWSPLEEPRRQRTWSPNCTRLCSLICYLKWWKLPHVHTEAALQNTDDDDDDTEYGSALKNQNQHGRTWTQMRRLKLTQSGYYLPEKKMVRLMWKNQEHLKDPLGPSYKILWPSKRTTKTYLKGITPSRVWCMVGGWERANPLESSVGWARYTCKANSSTSSRSSSKSSPEERNAHTNV